MPEQSAPPATSPDGPAEQEIVTSIKGFDVNWKCRGFQFALGETFTHTGRVSACNAGFHAIEGNPLEVFDYYPPGQSRYAEAKQSGKLSRHSSDSKLASAVITIGVELTMPELVKRAVDWIVSRCVPANAKHSEGDRSAASSTGDQSAASSTGDRSAASSTGDQSAASSTGYQSAASSTGYRSAASSTGDRSAASSTGYRSAASSTGDRSAASSTGDQSAASSTGDQSAAMSSGRYGRAMGADGCALFLVYRDDDWNITHTWSGIAGRNGIKTLVFYTLDERGAPVECEQ